MDSSPTRHINGLPDKVLEKIFFHLLPYKLVFPYPENSTEGILTAVCQRWSDLLWRRVFLRIPSCVRDYPDFFNVLYRMAPAVMDLHVECPGGIVANTARRIFLKFPTFNNVVSLQLQVRPNFTPMEFALVVELFPKVEKFYNIVGQYSLLGNRTLQLFASGWPNLIDIEFGQRNKLTCAGLIQFVTVANRLQSINLNGIRNLTDDRMETITSLLSQSLKSIAFGRDQKKLSELSLRSIVQNCPQLEEICIVTPKYNVGHLKHLANLRSLTIFLEKPANCEGLEEIFSQPQGQLRVLELENVKNVTDSLLTQIANGCPLLHKLEISMPFRSNTRSITDSGLDEIINKCRNLTELRLGSLALLTSSSLIGSRDKLPKLKFLAVHDCPNVDRDAVRAEFAGVQGLRVHFW